MVPGRAAGPQDAVRMNRQTVVSAVGRARGRSVARRPEGVRSAASPFECQVEIRAGRIG